MPGTEQVHHVDAVLANLAAGPTANRYLSEIIAPPLTVAVKTSKVYSIDPTEEARRSSNTARAPGAIARLADQSVTRPFTFDAIDHALQGIVPNEQLAAFDPAIQAEIDEMQLLIDKLMLDKELKLKTNIVATMTGAQTATVSIKWDVPATAIPIDNLKGFIKDVEDASGASPNTFVCDIKTIRDISATDEYKNSVQSYELPALNAVERNIAALIGIEEVVGVKLALENTAAKDATPVLSRIWDDLGLLFFKETARVKTRNFAMTMAWQSGDVSPEGEGGIVDGWRVERFNVPERKSQAVLVSRYYDELILNKEAGIFLTALDT